MLDWVDIWRVCGPQHSLNCPFSKEMSNNSAPVWAGVIVHEYKAITNSSGLWSNMWTRNFVSIWNEIQISVYLYKLCLFGQTYTTPNYNTSASEVCYRHFLFHQYDEDRHAFHLGIRHFSTLLSSIVNVPLPIANEILGAVSVRSPFLPDVKHGIQQNVTDFRWSVH